jgi:pimeloyl-ACP methyl ester carboxylesterase
MNVYFISGIGADERLFTHIRLPAGFYPYYIKWIEPLRNESIEAYAARLTGQMDFSRPAVIIGLSVGGIMASEIAKIHPVLTVLISSVPVASHLPPYYTWARRLGIMKALPGSFFKLTVTCKHALLMRSRENRKIVFRVIWSGNNRFIRWAMNAVLHWDNEELPVPYTHIHGTRDVVFPVRYTKPTHIIQGGHMLVMNHPEKINAILRDALLNVKML